MYVLLICADVYGEKLNLEIPFPSMPTVADLTKRGEEEFNREIRARRPQGYPLLEIRVAKMHVFCDTTSQWVELVSCTQLHEYDQIYLFQAQSPWHVDMQKDLPPPIPAGDRAAAQVLQQNLSPTGVVYGGGPSPGLNTRGSPPRNPITREGAFPIPGSTFSNPGAVFSPTRESGGRRNPHVPDDEKIATVFRDMDVRGLRHLTREDLQRGFLNAGVDYCDPNVVGNLFVRIDLNTNRACSYEEFAQTMRRFPNTLDALYLSGGTANPLMAVEDRLRAERLREEELLRQLNEVRSEKVNLEALRAEQWNTTKAMEERRKALHDQEKHLLQREYDVHKAQEELRRSEGAFEQSLKVFNKQAESLGSDRRARGLQFQ